jgi:putative ABC transport system permease protein
VRKLFALSESADARTLRDLARSLDRTLTDPGIQVQVPEDAATDEGRLLASVGDFLGLTSLVGLILAFIGCYWMLRSLIQTDAQSWAIYRVLSPRVGAADRPFWKTSLLLSVGALALAALVAQLLWWLAGPALSRFLLMEGSLPKRIEAATLLQALALSAGTLTLALVPSLRFLRRQNLVELLKNPNILAQKPGFLAADFAALALTLFAVARWVAHSWWVAGIFMAGLLGATLLLGGMGRALLAWLERMAPQATRPEHRTGLLALARLKASSLLIWITFALGALLITLMPLLQQSISRQISDPRGAGPVPSLFLFDIQEEQLEPARQWAQGLSTELQFVTPLIRGRLVDVNGVPFEKISDAPATREQEREARFRNRGFNLTYRMDLSPSERLVSGLNFRDLAPRPADAPEAVTVERRFAERLGLKIGDRLQFDIQGVPIAAEIIGLRQVQWTSFQPNFFIVFEPRALVDAPKTYLASLPAMPVESRESVQRSLFENFANISSIDVTQLMKTLLEGFSQISQALALMAALSSLAGASAILSVARLRARERMGELQLLKLLGMHPRALLRSVTGELAMLAAASSLAGLTLATALAGILSRTLFDSPVEFPSLRLALGVTGGFTVVGALLGLWGSRRAVSAPPQDWLRVLSQET